MNHLIPLSSVIPAGQELPGDPWSVPADRVTAGLGTDLDDFVASLTAHADFLAVKANVVEAVRARHAKRTRRTYDYWIGRLERWLTQPLTRHRFRELAPIPLERLWPMTPSSETIVVTWLSDLTLGPTDPVKHAEWMEDGGPMAPNTLSMIVAAIKARTAERQAAAWVPSTTMENVLRGLRRELREQYGSDRQAEPLLGRQHVAPIAQMLSRPTTPQMARDRLVLELHAAGVDTGGMARLRLDSLRHPDDGFAASTPEANEELYRSTGKVGALSLVVPGQRRRGGRCDPERVLHLCHAHDLRRALEEYLDHRCGLGDGPALLVLSAGNPHRHVAEILTRLAERSQVSWRPAKDTWAPTAAVKAMRRTCERGTGWSCYLRQRRAHVMLLVGYLCALRRSELCDLRIADVVFDGDRAIVTVGKSKTDQERRGCRLALARPATGPAYLDAVEALKAWTTMLFDDHDALPTDPLFPAMRGQNRLARSSGALVALSPQSWSEELRDLARQARLFGDDEQRYQRVTGHSLRRGFVTAAILDGHDPVTIAKQTRHKNVQMIATYADELQLLFGTDWATAHFGDRDTLAGPTVAGPGPS